MNASERHRADYNQDRGEQLQQSVEDDFALVFVHVEQSGLPKAFTLDLQAIHSITKATRSSDRHF